MEAHSLLAVSFFVFTFAIMSSARFYLLGVLFAMIWSSASVAAKLGMVSVQPLVLYQVRFMLAALCLLVLSYLFLKGRRPQGKEWLQLAIFGLLNVTVALGLFALAIHEVAAGIGALQVGVNPLVISVLSAVAAGRKVKSNEVLALVLGLTGVVLAVYPLLGNAYASPKGLFLLGLSTLAYSSAAIYYSSVKWSLTKLTINGWQAFFGALFLLPVTLFFYDRGLNSYDMDFGLSALWLGLPISGLAVYLWLWLLSTDTVKASLFLFLCPIFGFAYAYFILHEPFTLFTLGGLIVVMAALYIGQYKKRQA
ncbi:DMT family transporter [Jiulongibacter sediminis]|nr:DMT family transporter [Jiulongibacter sediminis]